MNAAVQSLLSTLDTDILQMCPGRATDPSTALMRPVLFMASQVEESHQDLVRLNHKLTRLAEKVDALIEKVDSLSSKDTGLAAFDELDNNLSDIYDTFFVGAIVEQCRSGGWGGRGQVSGRFHRGSFVEVHVNWSPDCVSVHTVHNMSELRVVVN